MSITKRTNQRGIAIITSVLLAGVILSIVFALSAVFIPKLRNAAEIKNSVTAAYGAESALEWCLYESRNGDVPAPIMDNPEITYQVSDCATSPVHASGVYRGVTRAFELTY